MSRSRDLLESTSLGLLLVLNVIGPLGVFFTPTVGWRAIEHGSVQIIKTNETELRDSVHPVMEWIGVSEKDTGQRVFVLRDFSKERTLYLFASANFILVLILFYIRKGSRQSSRPAA